MKNARTIVLGLGLVLTIGFVTSTMSRAQRAVSKSAAPSGKSAELRERIIQLRSDIDVLQVSYDGMRTALFDLLREMYTADFKGDNLSSPWGMASMELEATSGDADSVKSAQELSELTSALKTADDSDKILSGLRVLMQKRKQKYQDRLRGLKEEFVRLARELNEKKFNLAEAESHYQREVR